MLLCFVKLFFVILLSGSTFHWLYGTLEPFVTILDRHKGPYYV